jgi:chromosome partitioning protein
MEILVAANQKGGVGKTTVTANLAAALAEQGQRVLAVDLDPQANLTESFAAEEWEGSRLEVLLAGTGWVDIGAATVRVAGDVDLWPCSDRLADLTFELAGRDGGERRLGELLDEVRDRYDYVLIDSPPGIGFWSGLALVTADWVLIPIAPADLDVMSAAKAAQFIEREVRAVNPDVRVLGVLVNQAQRHLRLWRATHARLEADGLRALPVEIPRSVRVAEAVRSGAPLMVLRPDDRVAAAFRRLADLVIAETTPVTS